MNTDIISTRDAYAISKALEVLRAGGLVAFPTDTVYGIGALAFDSDAVESIYTAKERPIEKAIPILVGEIKDTEKVASNFPYTARLLASRFWPGPLTCIVPKKPTLPDVVSSSSTIGVRMPDHAIARILLRFAGPMAVTSANISGKESPVNAQEVYEQLNGRIELIIDGGETPGGIPSTLVDCTTSQPTILREGPISLEQILSAL